MIKGEVITETDYFFVLENVKVQKPDTSWSNISNIDTENKLEVYKSSIVFLSRNPK